LSFVRRDDDWNYGAAWAVLIDFFLKYH
jgi:hypothetical protein